MRKAVFLVFCLSLNLFAHAGGFKIDPGCSPGIGDGSGSSPGVGDNSEVTLPVGLPTGGDPAPTCDPAATSNIVYTFDLSDDNGASSVNQAHSAFENARNMNAACVLIRINSFAGGWDAAENIRQEIIGYDRPVMVYVNNQTIPAATFISSGADSIYTKKGSTISNKKASTKSKSIVPAGESTNANTPGGDEQTSESAPGSSENFSDDVTMNEILYKAGLGNLKVVQHTPGLSERAIGFLMHPTVVLIILLLLGFIMRKTVVSRLPGPIMYLLAFVTMLYLSPFQVSGLASNLEITASLCLIVAVIISARYEKRWLTGICLLLLTLTITFVRAGDTDAILQYGSFSDLITLPASPMGLVILGWWIGKIGTRRAVRSEERKEAVAGSLVTTA